ncbi:MAG: serine hydrolase domain-containing protein [Syntrophomonadaceae bacterium]
MKNLRLQLLLFISALLVLQALSGISFAQNTKTQEIDKLLTEYYNSGKFQGSVLIGDDSGILYEKGFGYANIELGVPNTPETKFRIASITKTFTSLLVMQQVEEGKVKLNARITSYIPDYPQKNGSRISIHNLLSHTSGMGHYDFVPHFFQYYSFIPYNHADFIKLFWDRPLLFEPGTKYNYSSFNYYVLGVMLEKITGEPYEDLVKKRIFDRIGMKNTAVDNQRKIEKNRASGYEKTDAGYQNATYRNMSTALATGDIISTVKDLYLWDRALYTDKLLPNKMRDLMFTPNLGGYGYGWESKKLTLADGTTSNTVSHVGNIYGFLSIITRYLDRHAVIILLCNSDKSDIYGITSALQNIIFSKPQIVKKELPLQQQNGAGAN